MQKLTLLMLVVVTTFEFFTVGGPRGWWVLLPNGAEFLSELMGLIACLVVLIAGTRNRFQYVRGQYWIVFGVLLVTILCGVLVNNVGAGPAFAGARYYLRAIPWFFIPAVFAFTDTQVKTQMKVLLVVALIQGPLALQQRLASQAVEAYTGDFTFGTMLISSIMTIFLIGAICIAAAMVVRGWLKMWQFVVLFLLLLMPTTINETKATIVLLPVALVVALLAASRPGRRTRIVMIALLLIATSGAIFLPVYEYFNAHRQYAMPLAERFSSVAKLEEYLEKTEDIGSTSPAGRIDSITVPLSRMMHDPSRLAFGFGIGNVSRSAIGRQFIGEKFRTYGSYLTTAVARVLLELGVFGVAMVLALMWMIFKDCLIVCRQDESFVSSLAAGWAGVTALITFALFYKEIISQASISFVFWYFSGLVAATRMRRLASAPGRVGKPGNHGGLVSEQA